MEISYSASDNTVNVKLVGDLDTPSALKIQPEIDKILALNPTDVNIDCSGLSYIASFGLRQFLSIRKITRANGGSVNLTGVIPSVKNVFSITNFDKIFNM